MSIVHTLALSTIIATAGLTAVSARAASTNPAPRSAQVHAASQAQIAKHAACEKVWAAQKVRHGTHQAFVAACVAKG